MAEDLQHDPLAAGARGTARQTPAAAPSPLSSRPPVRIAAPISPQPFALEIMLEKYAKGGETTVEEIYLRVARGVAEAEPQARRSEVETEFVRNFERGALGAGRIMSAAGAGIDATLINCFVQPVGDSIQGVDDEGLPGIYVALLQAAETMRRGGGVGYNFSAIRPKGARVHSTGSAASGYWRPLCWCTQSSRALPRSPKIYGN